ncbi:MAG: methylmalonyl-CoA epimerase [Candidatus Aminicenantes bacterium]|nr:methylmalonyl-CoA epimerase [Candidatus Aminicenantes bacterium]
MKGIHHIGIAVADLEESLARWVALFGAVPSSIEEIPEGGVRVVHLRFSEGSMIELLSPLGKGSPVAQFLEKRGEGVQHFTLEVDDIEAAFRELTEAGVQFISEKPQLGAGGARVAFIHPKSLNGVLVEIRQGRKPQPPDLQPS